MGKVSRYLIIASGIFTLSSQAAATAGEVAQALKAARYKFSQYQMATSGDRSAKGLQQKIRELDVAINQAQRDVNELRLEQARFGAGGYSGKTEAWHLELMRQAQLNQMERMRDQLKLQATGGMDGAEVAAARQELKGESDARFRDLRDAAAAEFGQAGIEKGVADAMKKLGWRPGVADSLGKPDEIWKAFRKYAADNPPIVTPDVPAERPAIATIPAIPADPLRPQGGKKPARRPDHGDPVDPDGWLLPGGIAPRPVTWRYTFDEPAGDWKTVDYDDSGWSVGKMPFGNDAIIPATRWEGGKIWLRARVELPEIGGDEKLFLKTYSDQGFLVYFNGRPLWSKPNMVRDWARDYADPQLTGTQRSFLRIGTNLIAAESGPETDQLGLDIGIWRRPMKASTNPTRSAAEEPRDGNPQVVVGVWELRGREIVGREDGEGSPDFAKRTTIYLVPTPWRDYDFSCRMTVADGVGIAALVSCRDMVNYGRVLLKIAKGETRIQYCEVVKGKFAGRSPRTERFAGGEVTPGGIHDVLVEVRGKDVRVLLDAKEVFRSTTERHDGERLALQVLSGTAVYTDCKVASQSGEVLWRWPSEGAGEIQARR